MWIVYDEAKRKPRGNEGREDPDPYPILPVSVWVDCRSRSLSCRLKPLSRKFSILIVLQPAGHILLPSSPKIKEEESAKYTLCRDCPLKADYIDSQSSLIQSLFSSIIQLVFDLGMPPPPPQPPPCCSWLRAACLCVFVYTVDPSLALSCLSRFNIVLSLLARPKLYPVSCIMYENRSKPNSSFIYS